MKYCESEINRLYNNNLSELNDTINKVEENNLSQKENIISIFDGKEL